MVLFLDFIICCTLELDHFLGL